MIYALKGKVDEKGEGFFVMECGEVFFKIFANKRTVSGLPAGGRQVKVYCISYFREGEQMELFGFLDKESLNLFELLCSVSGVGARTALRVLGVGSVERVAAAIAEGEVSVLARISGVGKKTAERVVLELRSKVSVVGSEKIAAQAKVDDEIEEVLVGLGYQRGKIRDVIAGLGKSPKKFEERLRKALKEVSSFGRS